MGRFVPGALASFHVNRKALLCRHLPAQMSLSTKMFAGCSVSDCAPAYSELVLLGGNDRPENTNRQCRMGPRSQGTDLSVCCPRLAALLSGDPHCDACFQHVEGKRAPVQNLIMERPDIILIPELGLRTLAQLEDFQLP
jgi:hypothetical protein